MELRTNHSVQRINIYALYWVCLPIIALPWQRRISVTLFHACAPAYLYCLSEEVNKWAKCFASLGELWALWLTRRSRRLSAPGEGKMAAFSRGIKIPLQPQRRNPCQISLQRRGWR